MDCINTDFKTDHFDAIVDKSTMDALYCGFNSYFNVIKYLWEIKRILKPNGVYIYVTYGKVKDRVPLLSLECFSMQVELYCLKDGLWADSKEVESDLACREENKKNMKLEK